MMVIRTVSQLRTHLRSRAAAGILGFVPTMGALHAGHAALFGLARRECAVVVASVFVNPTQFNDPKDLATYPRPERQDAEMAEAAGVDILLLPAEAEVYPAGHATSVVVGGAATGFEGDHRPGHFNGVATVCLKLFSMVAPKRAYFGQKDAQQVAVIRQMVADLNLDLEIRVAPTLRDRDGLALSSRNARLSPEDRELALAIPRALRAALAAHRRSEDPVAAARARLEALDVAYADVAYFSGQATLVIAARVGGTRLIDNVPLDTPALAGLDTPDL